MLYIFAFFANFKCAKLQGRTDNMPGTYYLIVNIHELLRKSSSS